MFPSTIRVPHIEKKILSDQILGLEPSSLGDADSHIPAKRQKLSDFRDKKFFISGDRPQTHGNMDKDGQDDSQK